MLEGSLYPEVRTDLRLKELASSDYTQLVQRIFSFSEPEQKLDWITELLTKLSLESSAKRNLKNRPGWFVPLLLSRLGVNPEAEAFGDAKDSDTRNTDTRNIDSANYLVTASWALNYADLFSDTAFEHWQCQLFKSTELPVPPQIVQHLNEFLSPPLESEIVNASRSVSAKERWLYLWLSCDLDWRAFLNKLAVEQRPSWLEACLERFASVSLPFNRDDLAKSRQFMLETISNWNSAGYVVFPKLIVLVEGPTEGLLLPEVAKVMGLSFMSSGIHLVVAGGSKPLVNKYLEYSASLKLPIVAVLDADATDQAEVIRQSLREEDCLFVFKGEIEDVFDEKWLLSPVCEFLQLQCGQSVSSDEEVAQALKVSARRVESLNILWRKHGLGDFDKIGFAKFLVHKLQGQGSQSIPGELNSLINILKAAVSNEVKT